LRELLLDGNENLVSPPPSVVQQGTEAVLNYLKALDEKTTVWTSKMVLVGEGGVGKTCLLDAIEGKKFEKGKDTTHGIDIRKLSFPCPEKDDICMELNVWDFGGQDIYHATHQFYLTNHALFVLVWSARLGYEAGKLYKWLETIQALAPDSPILVVATHSKERGADLPKGDIENKYPGKVHFFEVDNTNKQGIKELKEAIQKFAINLKYMGIERPLSWVNASEAIKTLRRKYLPKKELFRIFKKNGVVLENHETLAVYLHELGDILYYPDEEELKDTIIIKPAWVSQHIARILDSDEVSKREGFLHNDLMQELWDDLEPGLQDKFITLMEKFDLSYKTESKREISLIVEKLKYEEHPEYKKKWEAFEAEREIAFKYELDTIPAGIPTWFIARTHRFSQYIHWRNGVLLEDEEKKHRGLVIARPESKEVWLRVKGIMPYYFSVLLRDTLEFTFNRFEGLKRTAKVPCPGHKGNPCPHFFELNDLERKLKRKPPKFTIECPKAPEDVEEDVDVMKMLFGLSYAPGNQYLVDQITERVGRKINEQTKLLVDEVHELKKFLQLEFIKSWQIQHKIMDQTCPNLFTLKAKDSSFFTKPIDVDEFELQLYCQKPGCIHAVESGCYTVEVPKKWLMAISPYYNKMIKVLKWVLPVLQPVAGKLLDAAVIEGTKEDVGMLKEYIVKLPESKVENMMPRQALEAIDDMVFYKGAELRLIREILGQKDTSHHWGGLERVVTPEGHILWLCPEHAKEYK
jgi:small GTP-binding protein